MGVGLFSQVTSNRARANGLKLYQKRFRLDIGENCKERVTKHWNRLLKEMVESPSLEIIQRMCRCGAWGHSLEVDLAVMG